MYLIGVDLGGTQICAASIDRAGNIVAQASVATGASAGPNVVIEQLAGVIETVAAGVPAPEIAGAGVGAPGPVDPAAGVVLHAANLAGWRDVPLKQLLQQRTGLRVAVGNDANVAALGEWRFGCGRGTNHFSYVTFSTGIGAGVIVDGKLLLGHHGSAGEIGHTTIQSDGPLCSCGNIGCWQTLASGTALAAMARAATAGDAGSLVVRLAAGEPIAGQHVSQAARMGDATALQLMLQAGEYIGVGLVNLLHLYAPQRVALGGGMMDSFDLFEPHFRRIVEQRAMAAYRDTAIVRAELGGLGGVLGAAALVLEGSEGIGDRG